MIVGREVGGGVTLFFWQRLLSGTTNKKQITKYFLSHKHVQYGPRGVNVSQSELYSFRLGEKPLKWLFAYLQCAKIVHICSYPMRVFTESPNDITFLHIIICKPHIRVPWIRSL